MRGYRNFSGIFVVACVIACILGCCRPNPLDVLDEWDLVFISDSTGWGVAEILAQNIERDTGKTVRVHDYAVGGLPALRVLKALRSDPESASSAESKTNLKTFQSAVAEAEMIVFFANPRGDSSEGGVQGGMEYCFKGEQAPDDCTPELYEPYTKNLILVYEEIFALRNGRPTIIRAYDLYNPLISTHRENNIESECTECFETFNRAVQLAAEEFNIPFVSIYDVFNGINHDEDPREKGYIGSDGVHASIEGQQVIADLISALGYEPVER
jgi:hypothetical protein